jgi:cell division protease FtsH
MALPGSDAVQKVSIIPRGIGALGYTIQRPTEDRFLMDRAELMNRMAVLLGGRAAESLVFPEVSTGAADDLNKVTELARAMVTRFGMADNLGQVAYEPETGGLLGPTSAPWQPRRYSEATAAAIDDAVKGLIERAFTRARTILASNRALLDRSAKDLLSKETLVGAELARIREAVVGELPAPVSDTAGQDATPRDRQPSAGIAAI